MNLRVTKQHFEDNDYGVISKQVPSRWVWISWPSIGYRYSVVIYSTFHIFSLPLSHSFEFSLSSFVHLFCQYLCFYNEYGSVSLYIIQWKTADDQDEQILNFPDMAIANTEQENKKEELFVSWWKSFTWRAPFWNGFNKMTVREAQLVQKF